MLNLGSKLGPYEIVAPLGAGGMGEVYRARDTRLDRTVAIKVLNSQLTASSESRARFEREARVISQLQHPHICVLHDIGRDGDTDFLVMEFLEGESLADRLKKGPLPTAELIKIGTEISDALDKAHRAGIVHRDLKPGNVMLTKAGAKLLDFGLAKPAGLAAGASGSSAPLLSAAATNTSPSPQISPLTTQGAFVGTVQYMSPEQIEGKEADARSDIFAFGAMLYEMATGKRAFEGKSQISIASSILEKDPEPISSVQPMSPAALEYVVRTCLEKDPEQRFQNARDVGLQLKWISQAGAQGVVPRARKPRPTWLHAAIVILVAALALVATGAWWLRPSTEAPVLRATLQLPADYSIQDNDRSLSFSPDGSRLAMTLNHGGETSIWVRDMGAMAAQPIAGTENGTYPSWSPDGKSLAFFADRKLKRVDLNNGIVQTICDADDGRGIAWGRDDSLIFAPGPYNGLFRVPASGGTPEQLTHTSAVDETHRLPVFLPDGQDVLYLSRRVTEAHGNLNVLSLSTGKSSQIAQTDSGAVYASGYLFFLRGGTLVGQSFDASTLKLRGSAVPIGERVISSGVRSTGGFAASNSGLLAYGTNGTTGMYQYSWVDRDGKLLAKVGNPTPLSLQTAELSRDDKYLIIGEDAAAAIWLYDLARGVATRETFGSGYFFDPIWSPDGKHFAYAHSLTLGTSDGSTIFQIIEKSMNGNADTQELYRGNVELSPLSWSPDGKFIALLAENSGGGPTKHSAIWMLPVTGDRKPFPLVTDPGINISTASAQFSPNGKWFLYPSGETGRQEAYVVSFPDAKTKWQISQNGSIFALWLSDSEIFCVDHNVKASIVPIQAEGPNLEIGQAKPAMTQLNIVDVTGGVFSHDGKRSLIALPVGDTRPQLDVIANWSSMLKK